MTTAKTILLVDDDNELREALAEQFELHEGFRIEHAGSAGEGVRKAEATRADLIILDVELPDMDGRDACRLMRKHGIAAPIIMLTGQVTDADQILGLDSGANDYVTKPFKLFLLGPYESRPSAKLLIEEKERKIRLTEKETNILKSLYRAGGKPVGREELLSEVWGYNANVTTHTLETHIYRLRQKIEPDPSNARLFLTESGCYRPHGEPG